MICLNEDGMFLLETIGTTSELRMHRGSRRHLLGADLDVPLDQGDAAAVENRSSWRNWHNFGADYCATLRAWYANLAAHRIGSSHEYGERLYRMGFSISECAGDVRGAQAIELADRPCQARHSGGDSANCGGCYLAARRNRPAGRNGRKR